MKSVLQGLDWSYLGELAIQVVPALLCIMLHEISHGLAALALGDDTARQQGRLSLNPIRHVDWFGLVMLVVFHIGWARPVSVDMRRFRHPKRDMAITALAGPLSNFLLAAAALFLYGLLYAPLRRAGWGDWLLTLLNGMAYLSLSLGLFNLIPFPPLDGSKILFSLLPDAAYARLMVLERYGMVALMALVLVLDRVLEVSPVAAASQAVYGWFFALAEWGNALTIG